MNWSLETIAATLFDHLKQDNPKLRVSAYQALSFTQENTGNPRPSFLVTVTLAPDSEPQVFSGNGVREVIELVQEEFGL